jgi:hypothetical protein
MRALRGHRLDPRGLVLGQRLGQPLFDPQPVASASTAGVLSPDIRITRLPGLSGAHRLFGAGAQAVGEGESSPVRALARQMRGQSCRCERLAADPACPAKPHALPSPAPWCRSPALP